MLVKDIVDTDIVNYKDISMFIIFPYCTFKCGKELCQNSKVALMPNIDISIDSIIKRYISNSMSKAIVCGGLEPFDSWNSLKNLVRGFRVFTQDPIVIYTGYKEDELVEELKWLRQYKNILVKFGRFIPDKESHYDKLLGVELASPNQYGKWVGGNDEDQS